MSAKIVYYSDGGDASEHVAAEGAPVPAVVDSLRRLLAEAEAGGIRAIGLAIVRGSPATYSADNEFVRPVGTGWAIEAAARRLSRRLEED